jgi:hypothetical protein
VDVWPEDIDDEAGTAGRIMKHGNDWLVWVFTDELELSFEDVKLVCFVIVL